MVRVKQFADDLGISKNKAQALINKGRSRKDGGSQILENVMKKPIYASDGKITRIKKDKTNKAKDGGSSSFPDLTGDGKVDKKDILKGRGVPGFSRGGGMAIQGLGFTGVR